MAGMLSVGGGPLSVSDVFRGPAILAGNIRTGSILYVYRLRVWVL